MRDTVLVVRKGGVLQAEGSAVDSFNATPAGAKTGLVRWSTRGMCHERSLVVQGDRRYSMDMDAMDAAPSTCRRIADSQDQIRC